jgi:tRNA/rRNA methyltransferase
MLHFALILVRPARPANVGAVARAMKNFGWHDLRIVGSPDVLAGGAGHAEARALAWNAQDVLDAARPMGSLEEAVQDLHLAAAATARVEPGLAALTPRELALECSRLGEGLHAGVVLGPESHGLTGRELDLCRARVRIPTHAAQPSLNLAQAAVVLCYEVALACAPWPGAAAPIGSEAPPATEAEIERLTAKARSLLLRAGYLNPQGPDHVLGELRRLLARARPSSREVSLLEALAAQLDWAHRTLPE